MNHVPRRPPLIRLGRFYYFVRAAVLVWSISAVALAQTHADTTIVPPELVRDDGVLYPPRAVAEGFLESVTVALIVEIDALGRVTRAMVETPVGHGFEEASIEAGLRLRGAPPGNVGYYLDGVRVPALYHVLLGPSVIHPALVERVELHPGGYPARFGRFAGGIVTAEARAPQTRPHGEGNIRLFDAGALVESGCGGQRGAVLLGGRYSYAGGLFSLISPAITLDYRDYQIRTTYDLTPRDRLTLFGFGSYDYLSEKENGVENVLFASEFYRLDLRYDRTYEGGALRTAVTLGYDRSHLGTQPRAEDFSISIRTEFHQRLGGRILLHGGADAVLDAYRVRQAKYVDPDDPETVSFNQRYPPRDDLVMGVWADAVFRVTPRIEITPGIRLDLYRAPNAVALGFDPRLAVRFRISDRLRLVHAYGVAHQRPSATLPLAGLARGDLAGGLQTNHSEIVGAGCGAYVQAFGGYLRILDVTRPGAQRVGLLHGLGTCDFQFRVANPSADSVLGEGVSQADRTFMRTPGLDPYGTRGGPSIYIEGEAQRGAVEKRFAWAFRHRTDFRECAAVEGRLIVLEGEMDQIVDIRIRGTALFRERGAPPRFDPFAAADDVHGNRDGEVTLEELAQTPFGDGKGGTLGDAVYRDRALSVFGYRDSGTCTLRDGTDNE